MWQVSDTSKPPPPLLESLSSELVDPGYARAARRRAISGPAASASTGRWWLSLGALVVGLLLAVAFSTTRAGSADTDQTRQALLADVSGAQQRESELAASLSALNEEVRAAQSSAGASGLDRLNLLEQMNGLVPVGGPGLRIGIDDPEAASGNGAILDRDLQLLVNGLWYSGAEAVAIGGVRLRPTSAIRQAGGAILVDNQPVLWPMTVEAIGDPNTLQQRFVSTTGFGRMTSFEQLYGITFDVSAVADLSLPGAAAADVRYVETGVPDAPPTR